MRGFEKYYEVDETGQIWCTRAVNYIDFNGNFITLDTPSKKDMSKYCLVFSSATGEKYVYNRFKAIKENFGV